MQNIKDKNEIAQIKTWCILATDIKTKHHKAISNNILSEGLQLKISSN
jgi:hypothetical protein